MAAGYHDDPSPKKDEKDDTDNFPAQSTKIGLCDIGRCDLVSFWWIARTD
jgi:hypothetical protein